MSRKPGLWERRVECLTHASYRVGRGHGEWVCSTRKDVARVLRKFRGLGYNYRIRVLSTGYSWALYYANREYPNYYLFYVES